MISEKKCPKCDIVKSVDEFHRYFSKARNKYRVGNYCKECACITSKQRVKIYYQNNTEERKAYAKKYRENPKNKEKINIARRKIKARWIKQLNDNYVVDLASKSLKMSITEIRQHPEIIEAYRNNLKLKRKIKEYGKK